MLKKQKNFEEPKAKVSPINNTQLQHITRQSIQSEEVHSYFSFGSKEPNIKERSNRNISPELSSSVEFGSLIQLIQLVQLKCSTFNFQLTQIPQHPQSARCYMIRIPWHPQSL